MTFTRTRTGLSNLHLFYNVDAVVYVEGGNRSFSYSDIRRGQGGTSSPDILYWQAVFQAMAPDKKFSFKPVGSKSTLKQLAEDIRNGFITGVYVAMDQDLDRFHSSCILTKGVFYTWGYSWENDILQNDALKDAVFTICPIDRATHEKSLNEDISLTMNKFIRQARWFVVADVILAANGRKFFDRKNWNKYVKTFGGHYGEPQFDVHDLRAKIRRINSTKGNRLYSRCKGSIETRRDCFGHILGSFMHRFFAYLIKKYSGSAGISDANASALLVRSFKENLANPSASQVRIHHAKQFGFLMS